MAWVLDRETQNKMLGVMERLSESEKLALETLDRVRSKMDDFRTDDIIKEVQEKNYPCSDSDSEKSNPTIKPSGQFSPQRQRLDSSSQTQSTKESSSLKSLSRDEIMPKQVKPREECIDINKAWDFVTYHMDRISFHCECCMNSLPSEQMSKADTLHCQRFHNQRCNVCFIPKKGSKSSNQSQKY